MAEDEIRTIQRATQVYYDTYANLPSNVPVQSLGYATDRKVFYRYSGSAWQAVTTYTGSGAVGDIPTASNLPDGSLYFATDTGVLYQVQSSAWVAITSTTFWTPYATETPDGTGASIDFASLPEHDLWRARGWVATVTGAGGETQLYLRLNGISAASYGHRYVDNTSIVQASGATAIHVVGMLQGGSIFPSLFDLLVLGSDNGVSGTFDGIPVIGNGEDRYSVYNSLLGGNLQGYALPVDEIELFASFNLYGAIDLSYHDF